MKAYKAVVIVLLVVMGSSVVKEWASRFWKKLTSKPEIGVRKEAA